MIDHIKFIKADPIIVGGKMTETRESTESSQRIKKSRILLATLMLLGFLTGLIAGYLTSDADNSELKELYFDENYDVPYLPNNPLNKPQ